MSVYERFVSEHGLKIGADEAFASFATHTGGMHLYLLAWTELETLYAEFCR